MNYVELALKLDALCRPMDAAWAYEIAIHTPNASLDLFTNLVALYMASSDGGYVAQHHLSDDFAAIAFGRANEVLGLAELRYGDNPDIAFWRYYLREVILFEAISEEVYEVLATHSGSFLPHLRLYIGSNGTRYRDEMKMLLHHVQDGSTEKKRYINSVLSSAALPKLEPIRQFG